tara:strand:- start:949 stop:1767 length:819 start_codon:yes stop_codon:yes gene_type:complete
MSRFEKFNLDNKVALITGAGGLLGRQHAFAIAEAGGVPILSDIKETTDLAKEISDKFKVKSIGIVSDITDEKSITELKEQLIIDFNQADILINNASINPSVEDGKLSKGQLKYFLLEQWNKEIAVGLTGAFICSKIIGEEMAQNHGGVIVNISSDLGLIAPDQRIYNEEDVNNLDKQYKPITYSVIKHGIIGMTKYLSTYWLKRNMRVNALCPGGVHNNQPEAFISKVEDLIPLGRLASIDEYRSAIQFLCSDASSYMNGSCLIMDGGRSTW